MRITALLLLLCCSAPMHVEAASMYRCEIAGVTTYSDRPCGADAKLHQPDEAAVSTYAAPVMSSKPSATVKSDRATKKRRTSESNDAAKRVELCDRLARSLKEVRSKMRSGYKAKEGERLRERLAKLKAQTEDAKCR